RFVLTNETYLALDVYVSLNDPFVLNDEYGMKTSVREVNVPSKADYSFLVEFIPPTGQKRCSIHTGVMKIGFKLHPRTVSEKD
ncbi:hypothetical protein HHI36_005604, partial [Cryptolaemus montrouzieri]